MLREVLTPMPGELVLVQTRAPARGKTDGVKNIKETWRLARMVGSRTAAAIGSTWKRELGRETVRRRFVGTHRAYALSAPLAAMPDAELKKLKTVFTGDLDVGRMSALTKGGASLPAK